MKRRGGVRVGPSHYISGLGDGKITVQDPAASRTANHLRRSVHNNNNNHQAITPKVRDDDYRVREYRRKSNNRDRHYIPETNSNKNKNNYDAYENDQWQIYNFNTSPTVNSYDHHVRPSGPWQSSAFLLLAAVVLMSALFLHLISDTNEQKYRRRRTRRQPPIIVKNKKTDEWIDDAEEDPLALVKKKQQNSGPARPPSLYYHPYPPRLLQRQPHSKVPTNIPTSTNLPPGSAVASGRVPHSSTGMPPPPQQQTGEQPFPLYRTPDSTRGTTRPHLPSDSLSPKMSPPGDRLGYPRETRISPGQPQGGATLYAPPRAVPLPTDVSSFGSLTETGSHHEKIKHNDEEAGLIRSPVPNQTLSPQKSPILLSPGTEDLDAALRPRKSSKNDQRDLLEDTPIVANRRALPPPPPMYGHMTDSSGISSSTSSGMAFASPPKPRLLQQQQHTPPGIPYVPNLRAPPAERVSPPKSVNVQELQLYRMESGNVSHWQARVEEESQIIQKRIWSASGEETSSSTTDVIPSSDRRGGIEHKRDNITEYTQSAEALQGAIDFDMLELIEVIGGGGFGQVWKAKLRGTPVAVKVLTGSAQSKHVPKAVLEEFAAEINLLQGMRHTNICLYMGACVKPPHRAIITELAAHGSLWDALRLPLCPPYIACDGVSMEYWPLSLYEPDARHGAPPTPGSRRLVVPPRFTWPWLLVKRVAIGVARGMAYLHSGDPPVLHRDLKSANILLDESYNPKVCDFGLSRLKAHERSMTGNCGTVQWMAPEVLASKPYNEKADVYSFGIICWELLSRQCPYEGMTAIQCALAVLNRNKRPDIPKFCPPPLHALIRSCVKKNPDERPSFLQIIQAFDSMPDA